MDETLKQSLHLRVYIYYILGTFHLQIQSHISITQWKKVYISWIPIHKSNGLLCTGRIIPVMAFRQAYVDLWKYDRNTLNINTLLFICHFSLQLI